MTAMRLLEREAALDVVMAARKLPDRSRAAGLCGRRTAPAIPCWGRGAPLTVGVDPHAKKLLERGLESSGKV